MNNTFFFNQGGINHDEGQQQQELVDPIWDDIKITTQKSNVNMNLYSYII